MDKALNFVYGLVGKFKYRIFLLFAFAIGLGFNSVLKAMYLKNLINNFNIDTIVVYLISVLILETIWNVMKLADIFIYPNLKQHITQSFFERILYYNDFYFQKNSSTKLLNALRNIVDTIEDYIETLRDLISTFALTFATLVAFYMIDPVFCYLSIVWIFLLGICFYIGARVGSVYAFEYFSISENNAFAFGDAIDNVSTIKTFNGIEYELNRYDEATKKAMRKAQEKAKLFLNLGFCEMFFYYMFLILYLYLLYGLYEAKIISLGGVFVVLDRFQSIYYFLNELAIKFSDMIEYRASILNGLSLLYQEFDKKTYLIDKNLKVENYDVVIENLKFKYQDIDSYDFYINETICIKEGSTVAIVGPSGGGKTTFVKLMLRLLEPESGRILIGGQNIYDHSLKSLRSILGFIPQSIGLFNRTIAENIDYGIFENNIDDIKEAAKNAMIDQAIESMENKYDTILGEEKSLSGGQKQRIMIARSVLKQAKIFLFDESTSALDAKTESDVVNNIQSITKGCTKFIIAHRLNTIKSADLILVFDKGCIVEKGTHEELIKNQGIYYDMINAKID